MRFQSGPSTCGPAALSNALVAMGHFYREVKIAKEAGTTYQDGTSEYGLKQAVERLGFEFEDWATENAETAEANLYGHLRTGNTAVVLIENGEHWVAAIGVTGDSIIFFDSQNMASNKKCNGVHILKMGSSAMAEFWDKDEKGRFYFLLIKEKDDE